MSTMTAVKKQMSDGVYDAWLGKVYCKDVAELAPVKARICRLIDAYKETFAAGEDEEISVFSAPGRTELAGNHTDHQRGKVLTGSVDLDAVAVVGVNESREVNIFSEGYAMTSVSLDALDYVKEEENTTVALIKGVLARIESMGYTLSGFNAYLASDVPAGSGLSSSACFEVLVGEIVNGCFCKEEIPMAKIAQIGQYAENVYFGKPSGLMDQMGCAIGGMISIDFKDKENPNFHQVQFDFADSGYALCIVDTGADHADLTPDYAAIPIEMKQVAAEYGKEVLSEVEEEQFAADIQKLRAKLGDRAVLRAYHYYEDCKRTDKMVAALEKNDFASYLSLVNETGNSSFTYLQNISTYRDVNEQPVAVALVMADILLDGEGAKRIHGGGFAGTIQVYVKAGKANAFKDKMDAYLGEGACHITKIRPVGGCKLI